MRAEVGSDEGLQTRQAAPRPRGGHKWWAGGQGPRAVDGPFVSQVDGAAMRACWSLGGGRALQGSVIDGLSQVGVCCRMAPVAVSTTSPHAKWDWAPQV